MRTMKVLYSGSTRRMKLIAKLFFIALLLIGQHLFAAGEVVKGRPYLPDEKEILFYASFDKSLEPEIARGSKEYKVLPEGQSVEFSEGIKGNGAVIGPLAYQYLAEGNIGEKGALEMWLKPVDWNINEGASTFFTWANQGAQSASLYILNTVPEGRQLAFYSYDQMKDEVKCDVIYTSDRDFQPGKWRQVVLCWEGEDLTIYLDGKKSVSGKIPKGLSVAERGKGIYLGVPWASGKGQKTVIDELYFYDRPLSPEEVHNAYFRYVDPKKLQKLPGISISALTWPSKSMLKVTIDFLSAEVRDKVSSAELRISPEGGDKPVLVERISKEKFPSFWVKLPKLPSGQYLCEVSLFDEKGKLVERTGGGAFTRKYFPWEGNKIGLSDRVIPPYTPLKTKINTISPWGRDYTVGNNGLPAEIKVLGEDVLVKPIRLIAKVGGKDTEVVENKMDITSAKDYRVDVKASGMIGKIKVKANAFMEYDGWYQVKLKLEPTEKNITVDSLDLVFDLWPAADTLYIQRAGDLLVGNKFGSIPPGNGVVWDSGMFTTAPWLSLDKKRWGTFVPIVFVGTGDKGLWWVAETDEGWETDPGKPSVQIERNPDGTITLRFHLFAKPVTLDTPREIEFAIFASPVKPLPDNWRSIAWEYPEKQYVHETYGYRYYGDSVDSFALHTEEDYQKLKEFFRAPTKVNSYFMYQGNDGHLRYWENNWTPGVLAGKPLVLYGSGQMTGAGMEEFKTFGGEWLGDNNWVPKPDLVFKGLGNYGGTIKWETPEQLTAVGVNWTQSFVDCFIWYHKNLIEKCGVNGTWWDNSSIFTIQEYDEKREKIVEKWNTFMRRQLTKRLAVMGWEVGRPPFWLMNMHIDFPWCQVAWHIENDFGMPSTPGSTLLDRLTVDEFRTLTRVKGGIIPRLASHIYNEGQWEPQQLLRATRTIIGLCLLHDIGEDGLPRWQEPGASEFKNILGIMDDKVSFFGSADYVHYIPYWRQKFAGISNPQIFVSAYTGFSKLPSKNKNAVMILLNAGNEDVTIDNLTIKPVEIGFSKVNRFYDGESGLDLKFEYDKKGGSYYLAEPNQEKKVLKKYDFKLVVLEGE